MSNNPDEIREEIERTRAELSHNVNALGDSAKPQNMVREKVDQVKEGAQSFKERIFGSPYDDYDEGVAGDVRNRAQGLAQDAQQAIEQAPDQVKRRTQGNPLAAGLVALGIGALVGGLLPATRFEKDAAERVKDAAEPVVEQAKQMAGEVGQNLQPLAQEAFNEVKDTAQEAAGEVSDQAQLAASEVSDQAQWSAQSVQQDAQRAVDETRDEVKDVQQQHQGDDNRY